MSGTPRSGNAPVVCDCDLGFDAHGANQVAANDDGRQEPAPVCRPLNGCIGHQPNCNLSAAKLARHLVTDPEFWRPVWPVQQFVAIGVFHRRIGASRSLARFVSLGWRLLGQVTSWRIPRRAARCQTHGRELRHLLSQRSCRAIRGTYFQSFQGRGCNSRRLHYLCHKSFYCNGLWLERTRVGFPPPSIPTLAHSRLKNDGTPFELSVLQ